MDLMTHSTKLKKTLRASWHFSAIGTAWRIDTSLELPNSVRQEITQRIEEFDANYSRFREDSFVAKLREPGVYTIPHDARPLLGLYKELYDLTSGRMTPLIGSVLESAGYDANYSFVQSAARPVPAFDALGWDGDVLLRPSEPIVLDVGAAGKGYLVDIVCGILDNNKINQYTVDASGDIRTKGVVERVGLEHPGDSSKIIGVCDVRNQSLCASAINRRAWRGLHHVFDPQTLQPTDTLVASWVVANSGLVADGLATALFFVSPGELAKSYTFEYVTLDVYGAIDVSPGFNGELFV